MDKPTIEDYESVEDITGALSLLENIEKIEAEARTDKPLKDYGEVVISLI